MQIDLADLRRICILTRMRGRSA